MVSMKTLTGLALCTTEAEEWGWSHMIQEKQDGYVGFPFSSSVYLLVFTDDCKTLPFFILGLLMCFRVLTILNQSAYRCALQRYENWNDLDICMLQVRNRAKVST